MIQRLSSIRLTFALLTLLLVLMGTGICLTLFPEYKAAVKVMNQTIVYHWFAACWRQTPILTAWVLLVSLTAVILAFNTAICSMTNQLYAAIKIASLRRWSFFVIHFMFLLVLACHGITMVTGHKQENVRLAPGESHVFGENCRIDLVDVTFSDNPDFLTMNKKKRHQMMTRENFHPKQNFAKIALSQNGRQEGLQNVFFLTPLKHRSLRVTVADFILKEINGQKTVGVNLVITRNFFTGFFFTAYALMIIALACFIAITWKPRTQDI